MTYNLEWSSVAAQAANNYSLSKIALSLLGVEKVELHTLSPSPAVRQVILFRRKDFLNFRMRYKVDAEVLEESQKSFSDAYELKTTSVKIL